MRQTDNKQIQFIYESIQCSLFISIVYYNRLLIQFFFQGFLKLIGLHIIMLTQPISKKN